MSGNPSVYFEIYVQDLERARKFYEGVFQKTLKRIDSPVSGLQMLQFEGDQHNYGASGAIVKMDGVPSGGNSTLVYFGCKDCAVEAERVVKHGGSICKPKMSIGQYGFIVLVNDTEGNMIGLHSM